MPTPAASTGYAEGLREVGAKFVAIRCQLLTREMKRIGSG